MKRMILCFLTVTMVLLLCGCAVQPPAATTLPTVTTSPTVPPTTTLPQIAEPFVPGRYIYWNRPDESEPLTLEDVGVGQLYIRDELSRAVEAFADEPDAVYAVSVLELTGASRQEIYEKYVRHLDVVHEEYLLRQVIFVSRQQLEKLQPHEDLAIVLKLKYGSGDEPIYVKSLGISRFTQEEFERLMNTKITDGTVHVQLKFDRLLPISWPATNNRDENIKLLQDIFSEYGHSIKNVSYSITTYFFTFIVDKEALWDLFTDVRFEYLIITHWGGEFYATEKIE